MRVGVLSGDERSAAGNADGRGTVGAGKAERAAGEAVDVGSFDGTVPIAAAGLGLVLIGHQEKQVKFLAPGDGRDSPGLQNLTSG